MSVGPISAVVVNYNGAHYLVDCIAALLAQEPPPAEIVVVDNASSDGSQALVAAQFPSVRWLAMESNLGPAPARNAGLKAARSRWVLLVDNDAVLEPGCLARLASAAASELQPSLVQPRSVFFDDRQRVHYDGGAFHYCGLIALRNFYTPLARASGQGVVEVDCAVSVVLLADRERVLAIGGFDPRYFILFEDLDLSYRLRAHGQRIVSVEDALVLHKGGTGGISYREGPRYPARRVFLHARNRWMFLIQNFRMRTLLVALPGLMLYELASFGFACAARAPGQWFAGRWAALRQVSALLSERQRRAAWRTLPDRELLPAVGLSVTPDARAGWRAAWERALSAILQGYWKLARVLLPSG